MRVLSAINYLWLGLSTLLVYPRQGVSAVLRYLWLGLSTILLALGWTLGYLQQGALIILQGLRRSPLFVLRTVWTAYTAVPDVWRTGVWVAKHRKEVSEMSD